MTRRSVRRIARYGLSWLLVLFVAFAALPPGLLPAWFPLSAPKTADAETLSSPRFASAALMPNGQVGLIFLNVNGSSTQVRFAGYKNEHALGTSQALSTAGPWYPQLAVLGSTLVAAYVDTRSPNAGKLILRTSTDNGATWSGETNPFGSATFDTEAFAPRLVSSHAGTTLYLFSATDGAVPQYRSTTDLSTWTTAAAAGDTSMGVTSGNNCGSAGQECYRAHAFELMETATTGSWVYITKSASGYGQSGRGTQVGTLGGSWSTQVDHQGSGGLSGGGESTATTFLARDGSVYYLRAGGYGESLYFKRSTDGGLNWGPEVLAYPSGGIANYTTAAPVGVYAAAYTMGEYVWYAGFGGTEDTLRVTPLWSGPLSYPRTGTARLLGSAGGDLDTASAFEYNFGQPNPSIDAGGYSTSAVDLTLPGRLLPFTFARSYNSGDSGPSVLGPGWTHSFDWSIVENGNLATLKRGSGERDRFTRNTDGTYTNPPGVFGTLTKHTDGTFTFTTREQVSYELGSPPAAYSTAIGAAGPVGYWRLGETSGTTATDATANHLNGTYSGSYAQGTSGAIVADSDTAVTLSGGYADMGSPTALNVSGSALSVEFWARGSPGTYNYLLAHTDGASQGYAVYTGGDGTYHFYIGRGGGAHVMAGVSGTWDGAWHHFANVYDGSTMKVYVDGVIRATETETAALTGYTGNFRVGGYNGGGYTFGGSLDEVAAYSRALSATEIANHYSTGGNGARGLLTSIHEPAGNALTLAYSGGRLSTVTDTVGRTMTLGYGQNGELQTLTDPASHVVRYGYDQSGRLQYVWDRLATTRTGTAYATQVLANSPAAYWRLGESSGTSAADASGNGNTGTYAGGVTLGATGAIAGDSNTAISVNGSAYLTAAATGGLNVTGAALSVEGWVKGASQPAYSYLVSKSDGGGTVGYALYTGPSATLTFFAHTSGSGLVSVTAPTSPWDNQWHYVAGTYDGSELRLNVDGVPVASHTATGSITSSSAVALNLGRYNGGGYAFTGSLDEFAITPSALTDLDIAARVYGTAYGTPSWQYAYDGTSRHITQVTDPDGRAVVTNTYDALGELATQKDGLNNSTSFAYTSSTLTTTDPRSHATTQTFDSRRRPTSVQDTLGSTTYTVHYTYDDCGNRSSTTDRDGNRTDFAYDTACKGNLLTVTAPQIDPSTPRYTTTYAYDTKNNVTSITDPRGVVTTKTYDATTNLLKSVSAEIDATATATVKYEYTDTGNPGLATWITAPRGNTGATPNHTYAQSLAYDSSGNLATRIDADGAKTTYAYDDLGRQTSFVDPEGYATGAVSADHTWTTTYDADDRVLSTADPLSHSSSSTYDGAGHRLTTTDPNGNVTTYTYDAAGQLATVVQQPDPSGHPTLSYTTTIARDANGNATSLTQANGVVTDYGFDGLDQLTSVTSHPTTNSTITTSYTLDGNGQPTAKTLGDGSVINYGYDTNARLISVAASGLTTITYAYDESSELTQMVDGTGTTTYTYDGAGRLTQAAQPNGTTSYGYDLDGNRTTLGYPTVGNVAYTYSPGGRLSGLTDWASHTASYTYTASGLAATVSVPGGMTATYTYDRAHRLTNLVNAVGGTTITSHAYTLDATGNRTAQDEFISGITTGTTDHFGYSYDGLERLTAGTTTNAESFTLDAGSNIASRTGPSATYTYDTSNRLTNDGAQTFTWNTADRLTDRGSDTFSYDALDRMTSSTVSATARTYTYNGGGLLKSRTQGASTTQFLWDPSSSPSRLLLQGSDKLIYGLGPLWVVKADGTTSSFARDGGKSVRAEVNGSGTVTASFRYRAYGAISQSNGASMPSYLGYAGQLQDLSGLLYMRARWYDPATGRFTVRDPASADPASPGTLNPFGYAAANPALRLDPTGLAASLAESGCETAEGCAYQPASDGNWAYAAADVFRDLDSRDAGTRSAAYAKVGLTGLVVGAIGAGAWAGASAVAGAAAAGEAVTSTTVFIGETASRVAAAAAASGGIAYKAANISPGAARMEANMSWIDDVMRQGLRIVDIGRDPAKVQAGLQMGRYYMEELHRINAAAYEFYYPIIRR